MANGGSNTGGSSGGGTGAVARPGIGSRAVDAALSAPTPFRSRAMSVTDRNSARVVDRWAPEGGAEDGAQRRSRSLGTLAFADRLLTSYVRSSTGAGPELSYRGPSAAPRMFRSPPMTSWLFPVPWYQDELDWIEAARQGQLAQAMEWGGSTQMATPMAGAPAARLSRGTPALGSLPFVAPALRDTHAAGASVANPAVRVASGVAPMGAPLRGILINPTPVRGMVSGQNHRLASNAAAPLRAWSPLVSFPAAQAAEVMASALANTPDVEVLAGGGVRSMAAPMMELIAPRDLAEASAPASTSARTAEHARSGRPSAASHPAAANQAAAQQRIQIAVRQVAAAAAAQTQAAAAQFQAPATALGQAAQPTRPVAASDQAVSGAPAPRQAPPATSVQALLAAAAAAPSTHIAPAGGPRVAMPAGLGGFVVGVEAANVVARPLAAAVRQPVGTLPASAFAARPALVTSAGPQVARAPQPVYASSALAAIGESRPASLDHVAWSDRWLARFAGASPVQLASMAVASEAPNAFAFNELLSAAPAPVFLSLADAADVIGRPRAHRPEDRALRGQRLGSASPIAPSTAAARPAMPIVSPAVEPAAQGPRAVPPAPRIADDAAVPASVFEAIARGALTPPASRGTPPAAAVVTRPEPVVFRPAQPSASVADQLLSAPPIYGGPGLHAGLSSSPVAPALAGVLDLPSAPLFDVRSTSASGVARAYLAGGIRPVAVRARRPIADRGVESTAPGELAPTRILGPLAVLGGALMPLPAGVQPHHPRLLQALLSRAPEATFVAPFGADTGAGDEPRGLADAATVPPRAEPTTATAATVLARDPAIGSGIASPVARPSPAFLEQPASAAAAAAFVPAATMGWPTVSASAIDLDAAMRPAPAARRSITAPFTSVDEPPSRALARQWAPRPGSTGQMVQAFSFEQEHAAGDLSFDFVPPEVVLAARQYGFGPAEAVAAVRLAAGGASRLAAMASAMDFAFVQAFAGVDAEPRRMAAGAESYGYPLATASATQSRGAAPTVAAAAGTLGVSAPGATAPDSGGGEWSWPTEAPRAARLPRGAFLWPASSATAMQLRAGDAAEHPMAMAALDLLAAQVVVEAGRDAASGASTEYGSDGFAFGSDVFASTGASVSPREAGAMARALTGRSGSAPLPPEFESIYVALAASSEGRAMPVAARAARALALAEQASPGTGATSARARAAAAWAVMPMVLNGELEPAAAATAPDSAGGSGPQAAEARPVSRRSQAGESLRALVAPSDGDGPRSSDAHAADEAPARRAVPREVVRTGSSPQAVEAQARAMIARARTSGAQPDLPDWFEAAARRLIEEGQGSGSDGMSLAEMTLVTAAPARHIAASARTADSPAAPLNSSSPSQGSDGAKESPDVEALAQEIFAEVCRMFEIVKERNGDPWLS